MDKTLLSVLVACTVLVGLVYFADGQGNFMNRGGYPGYPGGGGGYPGYPGGGGGYPGYPGGGGGYPGYPGGGGGGYPGYPGGGGHCKCRRYCWRSERYAGRCHRPWRRRHFRRRLVRCCPRYGPFGR